MNSQNKLDIMEKAYGEGFLTPLVPKEYGGGGRGILDTCLISEELAAGDMGIFVSIFVSTRALYPIIQFGTKDPKDRFLRPFCEKFTLASYCLSEYHIGSDPASLETTATLKRILHGTKVPPS